MSGNSKLDDIKLLVLDVDGVLTDGTIIVDSRGEESKFFNAVDGHGIRLWRRAGLKVAFISGRASPPVDRHAEKLGVDYVYQDCHYKLPVLEKLVEELGLSADDVAYVGDDLPDLPAIKYAGFGVAVAGAVEEVKQHADYITTKQGGNGAVREVIEYLLRNTGRWQEVMKRYLS